MRFHSPNWRTNLLRSILPLRHQGLALGPFSPAAGSFISKFQNFLQNVYAQHHSVSYVDCVWNIKSKNGIQKFVHLSLRFALNLTHLRLELCDHYSLIWKHLSKRLTPFGLGLRSQTFHHKPRRHHVGLKCLRSEHQSRRSWKLIIWATANTNRSLWWHFWITSQFTVNRI